MAENVLNLNLSSYQKQVSDLTAKLSTLEKGTAAYNSTQKQLQAITNQAASALASANSAVTTTTASMGSMSSSLNTLTESFRTANSAFEQQQISAQMSTISNSMSAMQENASSSFSQVSTALSSLGVPINGVVGLVTNLQSTMTSLSTVLTGGIAAVKAFGAQLNTLVSSNPYLAAIAAVLGTLVGVFKLFSNNLKENAGHGKQWKRIMATFTPVINIVKNALDKVFGVILDGMEWVADNLPAGLKWIGKNANWLIQKVLVPIVTAVDYIPKKVREALAVVVKVWAKGWSKVAGMAADVVEWFGLDSLASKIRNFSSMAVSAINSVADSYASFDAGSALSSLGNSIESSLNSVGNAMKTSKKMESERQDIVKAQQDQEYKNIQVEGEIAKLRDQAAKTSNKAEKKRLNERAKQLEEANSKENILLKERYYNYLKWRNAQSATSAAEAKEERDARNDIERERTASYQRQIKLDKAITSNTETSSGGSVAVAASKEVNKTVKEIKKVLDDASTAIVQSWEEFIAKITHNMVKESPTELAAEAGMEKVVELFTKLPSAYKATTFKNLIELNNNVVVKKVRESVNPTLPAVTKLLNDIYGSYLDNIEENTKISSTQKKALRASMLDYLNSLVNVSFYFSEKDYMTILNPTVTSKLTELFNSISKALGEVPKSLVKEFEDAKKELGAISDQTNIFFDGFNVLSSVSDTALEKLKDKLEKTLTHFDDIVSAPYLQKFSSYYNKLFSIKEQINLLTEVVKEAKNKLTEAALFGDEETLKKMQENYNNSLNNWYTVISNYISTYNTIEKEVSDTISTLNTTSENLNLKTKYELELKALLLSTERGEQYEDAISKSIMLSKPKLLALETLLKDQADEISNIITQDNLDKDALKDKGDEIADYLKLIETLIQADNELATTGLAAKNPKKYKWTDYSNSSNQEFDEKIYNKQSEITDYQVELVQLQKDYYDIIDKEGLDASENLKKQAELRYNIEKANQEKLNLLAEKNQTKRTKIINQTLKVYSQMASAVGTICSDISSYQQSRIESELEAGKITEQEAQAQFERTKRTAIAGAIISLLGTIPSEIYTIWKDGSGLDLWGKIAMTATTTASTIAAGVLQIQKLRSTTLNSTSADSSSSGVSASMAAAQATPLLDENQDIDKIQQLKVQTEQRVYILEQDIQDSNKRVQVRERNTTF